MRLDKKKIKKFQKISVWILFLCVMILMFLIGAAFGDGEEDAFSELMLSLVIPGRHASRHGKGFSALLWHRRGGWIRNFPLEERGDRERRLQAGFGDCPGCLCWQLSGAVLHA